MVNYVTTDGIVREFSDIDIVAMKNGSAQLIQHVASGKYDENPEREIRRAVINVADDETKESLWEKLNDEETIINGKGNIAKIKYAV
jgi:hypothetical protein